MAPQPKFDGNNVDLRETIAAMVTDLLSDTSHTTALELDQQISDQVGRRRSGAGSPSNSVSNLPYGQVENTFRANYLLHMSELAFHINGKELRYLTAADIKRRYRISNSTLYKWIAEGRFPSPFKIGPRAVRFCPLAVLIFDEALRQSGK